MSLPTSYTSYDAYFSDTVEFLNQYSWIFRSSNTELLKDDVFDMIPRNWIDYFITLSNEQLNSFPQCNSIDYNAPSTLISFQENFIKLKPKICAIPLVQNPENVRGLNPKKLHEITELTEKIQQICGTDIDIMIDFGSGLGYLAENLYKKYEMKILGLESNSKRVESARKRQIKYYSESVKEVFFETHFIDANSGEFLKTKIKELYPESLSKIQRIAIVGLHSCADLSVASIDLCLKTEGIEKMIQMPCCYHKMKLSKREDRFENIPLSRTFKRALDTSQKGYEFLNRPFLRLASQQTVSRWIRMSGTDHLQHGKEMFFRNVIQFIRGDDERIEKIANIKPSDELSFNYLKKIYTLFEENSSNAINWSKNHTDRCDRVFFKYPNGHVLSEILSCLQTSLQGLCENLVLLDRLCYVNEMSDNLSISVKAEFIRILDDEISPRCFALIIRKDQQKM